MKLTDLVSVCLLAVTALSSPLRNGPGSQFFDVVDARDIALHVRRGDKVSDQDWDKAVCRGGTMLQMMRANDHDAGQMMSPKSDSAESRYLSFDDVHKWGWGGQEFTGYVFTKDNLGIDDALRDIDLSDKRSDWAGSLWLHGATVTVNGRTYPATNGSFTALISRGRGGLISLSKFSPQFMSLSMNPKPTEYTELRRFSDLTYLQWAMAPTKSQGDVKNLKHVLYTPVENEPVLAIIERALSSSGQQLKKWPGMVWGANDTEAKAILGSPYGTGVSFLLFQHKKELGNKIVEKVQVWQDAAERPLPRPPSLVFHIKDA